MLHSEEPRSDGLRRRDPCSSGPLEGLLDGMSQACRPLKGLGGGAGRDPFRQGPANEATAGPFRTKIGARSAGPAGCARPDPPPLTFMARTLILGALLAASPSRRTRRRPPPSPCASADAQAQKDAPRREGQGRRRRQEGRPGQEEGRQDQQDHGLDPRRHRQGLKRGQEGPCGHRQDHRRRHRSHLHEWNSCHLHPEEGRQGGRVGAEGSAEEEEDHLQLADEPELRAREGSLGPAVPGPHVKRHRWQGP